MNPLWDAAQAALALVLDCLEDCTAYPRVFVDTAAPVFDCSTIVVVLGPARAFSGSCVGRAQLRANLDITIVRCCEPVGTPGSGTFTPPTPEEIEAAAACLVKDALAILNCVNCRACDTIGTVRGVEACCDQNAGAPEIIWSTPSGGCRSAIVRVPIVFTLCCE